VIVSTTVTLGRDRDFFTRNETIRNHRRQESGSICTSTSTDAGKASGVGAINEAPGTHPTAVSRISRRAVIGSLERSGHRHDPGQPDSGGERLAPRIELVCERVIDHERPIGSDACMDSDIPSWLKHDPDIVAQNAIPRAPIYPAPTKPPVLSISQIMAAEARLKNSRPCPPGLCDQCWRHACRMLDIGCCICTGHINPNDQTKFIR
jgi:hypothetical protein